VPETFTPYRDRPALDKGPLISWTDLESGMLFQPLAGAPTLRRVRGVPQFIWYGIPPSPSYMIGSEDEADGRPCGGVIGVGDEQYRRSYLPDGRAVYTSNAAFTLDDEATIERLRTEFQAKIIETEAALAEFPGDFSLVRRAQIAQTNLTLLEERRDRQ
jgi:hypothetical protein